jgi:hypothetical protein
LLCVLYYVSLGLNNLRGVIFLLHLLSWNTSLPPVNPNPNAAFLTEL